MFKTVPCVVCFTAVVSDMPLIARKDNQKCLIK